MKERIKNKLRDSKKISESKLKIENDKTKDESVNENAEEEEYYFGKYRDEERKKKAYVIFYYIDFKTYEIYLCIFRKSYVKDKYSYCMKFNLQ